MTTRHNAETLEAEAGQRTSAIRFVQPNSAWQSSLEWTVVAALAVVFATRSVVPAWQSLNSEFPNYYLAAKLYQHHVPLDRIYEWTWFQRQNDHWGVRDGLVSFAPNPPTLILASAPLAGLQPLAAKRAWLVLSLASLALSVGILRRVTTLSWRRLALITLLCVLPLNVDFLFGRHYVVILTLVCAAYYAAAVDRHGVSGAIWSIAAAMKLFPALVVIFFLRKRNVRALVGFLTGLGVLGLISVAMFGAEVHRVFLREVLSQASRGDWLGPYTVSQNSFTTLWSRLFLAEPELNPLPLVNSPLLFALALAISVAALVCIFLWLVENGRATRTTALQWAALVPLMLLLSTTTAPDYWCLMIFSAIIGVDALLARGDSGSALILLLLYVAACAPMPARISNWFPTRLLATTALFAWLLHCARAAGKRPSAGRWLAAGLISAAVLTFYNLHWVQNREEDFSRRVPALGNGYRFANPVPVAGGLAYTEMQPSRYTVGLVRRGAVNELSLSGDALSLAGSSNATALYSELTGRESLLVQVPVDQPGSSPERLTEGQDPTLSSNGKWLAFIREEHGRRTAWLQELAPGDVPQTILPSAYQPLDLTVTDDGDVIAAAGNVSDPSLLRFVRSTREISPLSGFPHPTRYPSISPDGQHLAFCRRDHGFWHLYVRNVATGVERQLTHAWCNALSPSWADTQTLFYATDCARAVGLTAIARVVLPE
jgi:hypothetical protein